MLYFTVKMSEEKLKRAIRENKLSNQDWVYISEYQELSEEFIREFQNEVDWV